MAGSPIPIPSLTYSPSSAAPFRGTNNTLPRQIINIPVQPLAMAPITNPSFAALASAQNSGPSATNLFGADGLFGTTAAPKSLDWQKIALGLGIVASLLVIKKRFL